MVGRRLRLPAAFFVRRRVGGREGLINGLVIPLRFLLGFADERRECAPKCLLGVGKRNAILRTLGSGNRRYYGGQVELEPLGIAWLGIGVVPQALRLGIGLYQ